MKNAFVVVLSAVLLACGGSPSTGGKPSNALTATGAVGAWTGDWKNTTFSSVGPAKANVTVDTAAKSITFKLDLDGSVFGTTNPPEETFTGTYDDTKFTMSGSSTTFGALSLTVNADGTLSGSANPSTSHGKITLDGSASGASTDGGSSTNKIVVNYTFNDGTKGTITLAK